MFSKVLGLFITKWRRRPAVELTPEVARRRDFLNLPPEERRRLLETHAERLEDHYRENRDGWEQTEGDALNEHKPKLAD